ncbi:MAG: 2-C-methyl-D-erythritol 2,4-cyclodiphosphate synthase [Candidatus Curtissbacteria bacterium]|nr:2-C-methyl-D-erythritol 2,4-cyclodiphosphate synthase [Candidatus Curtissbacteria bacterium]
MGRIGIGQDSHVFDSGKKALVLGGVKITAVGGFIGNSDGDVILHSLCNALSSAIGGDSLSTWSDEMCKKGIKDSKKYVGRIFKKIKEGGYKVGNVSISVEAKRPYIALIVAAKMKEAIAKLLEIDKTQVGITFTSGEGLTPFGKGEGIQSIAAVILSKDDDCRNCSC